ncbi:MAG: ABC transporter ATP-binding protein [bacterium]
MILLSPLLMLVEVAMDLVQPRLMQRIVDVGIARLHMAVVVRTGLLMVGLALVGFLGGAGNTVFAVEVSQGFGADLRRELFRKVQSLSFGNLDDLGTGQLVTRLTNDVTQVQESVLIMLRILVRAPLMLTGSIFMAVITSPKLSFLLLILGPLVVMVLAWAFKRANPLFTGVQSRLDRLNTVMQENLAGIRLIRAFVRKDHEIHRFGEVNDNLMDQTIRAVRTLAVVMPFMMLALNLGIVGVIWFGGLQVMKGTLKAGQIMAFVNYILHMLFSLIMVSMLLIRVSRAEASAGRIMEILNKEPEVTDRPDAVDIFSPRGKVVFEHVCFNYNGNSQGLRDINFTVEPGQTVAIIGATGSGKSSLVHLLPRFYDATEGRVMIDGVDVRDIKQESLRKHISITLQEAILFSGTIRENICYGRPEATEEEIIEAARAAQAHEFITEFPAGYDTVLGERGINLSGGQKQRLALARAIITKPSILILDDSTSAVDIETEANIHDALIKFIKGCTCFIITQRLGTVLRADKILVLDNGTVTNEGTHQELLILSPIYREIYESQLGNGANFV